MIPWLRWMGWSFNRVASMASKQVNPNIGMIPCLGCSRLAAVRKNRADKLYYDCVNCGRVTPNLPGGQSLILERAVIWGEQGTPPADCPEWIAGNWPWHKAVRQGTPAPRPAPAAASEVPPGEPAAPAPAPARRARPRMPPPPAPPAAPVRPPKPTRPPEQAGGGFGFLEGW